MSGFSIASLEVARYFTIIAAIIVTYAYFNFTNYNNPKHSLLQRLSLQSIFLLTIAFFGMMFYTSIQPKEWDYTCFFLIGKVARFGFDIYNPDHYFMVLQQANLPFALSPDFKSEFMVTACLYPPPTVFLFLPLGFMTYTQGLYFFYALILLASFGCIYQIRKTFFKGSAWQTWMMACIIVMFTAPFYTVIYFAQTLIFLLFFLLLVYRYKDKKIAGLYLAVSIFIKPFAIVFFIYFLLKKRWDIMLTFILSVLALMLVTALCFGIQPFYEYFFNNPSQRIPDYILFEGVNQSLLAVLTRKLANFQLAKIVYYIISGMLLILSGLVIVYQAKKRKPYDLLFPLLLSVCLIIYPNALYHYAVVLILSLMIIVNHIRKPGLIYLFLFFFFIVLYGRIFYLNIYLVFVSLLLIFEDEVKKYVDRQGMLPGFLRD